MEKRYAIVTGASSGIGHAIAESLTEDGWHVFGFGRTFSENESFETIVCDFLAGAQAVADVVWRLQKEHDISLLVNAAGVAYYGLHEELSPKKIHEMLLVNVEVPFVLCQQLLRTFKQNHGTIVQISSVTALHSSPRACVYGATKAALSDFSESLFDEARKYGVRVVTIQPDMTDTKLYRNADFSCSELWEERLEASEIADAVLYAVHARDGMTVREITLRPQKNGIRKQKSGFDR